MSGRLSASRTPLASTRSASKLIEIAARHRIEAYAQGDFDGLCSILSAVNALRLAMEDHWPLSKSDCWVLFAHAIDYLNTKHGLSTAAVYGIGLQRRLALTRHLAKLVSTTECEVVVERPDFAEWRSIDDVFAWIELSLVEAKPVMVSLAGGLNHYTTIAGISSKSLFLLDSQSRPQRLIRRSSCALRGGFYQILPNGLLRIAIERTN